VVIKFRAIKSLCIGTVLLLSASSAAALPFNDGMVDIQPRTGAIMKPKAPNSVPKGSLAYRIEDKTEAETLSNPLKGDKFSAKSGKRLYKVNCYPCHGDLEAVPYAPGPVASKYLPTPDIGGEAYKTRSDGNLYGIIHFGSAIMPALGYKLSPTEHWDIINYVRSVQDSK